MEPEAVAQSALALIANHYAEHDLNALWISSRLAISQQELNGAFAQNRRFDCDRIILNFRLCRLFEQITSQPEIPLKQQVASCGLGSIQDTDPHFRNCFGIDLRPFHDVSLRAAEDRQFRRSHPQRSSLIINE